MLLLLLTSALISLSTGTDSPGPVSDPGAPVIDLGASVSDLGALAKNSGDPGNDLDAGEFTESSDALAATKAPPEESLGSPEVVPAAATAAVGGDSCKFDPRDVVSEEYSPAR